MRVIAASILGVATAFRTNTFHAHVQKHETKEKFGATCEDLHESFSSRLSAIQETVDSLDLENGNMGSAEQIRLTMRLYGIGRTMRRARECEWMQAAEGTDGENAVKVRNLVTTLFAANPCGEEAREALQAAPSDTEQEQAVAMQRAMSILTSETCEPTEVRDTPEEMEEMNDTEMPVREDVIEGAEEAVCDQIEEMVQSEGTGSSFIQSKGAIERLLRFLIAIAIFIFLMVLCTAVVVWIGMFIIEYFAFLLGTLGFYVSWRAWEDLIMPPALLACGYDLFFRILDPEISRLAR